MYKAISDKLDYVKSFDSMATFSVPGPFDVKNNSVNYSALVEGAK